MASEQPERLESREELVAWAKEYLGDKWEPKVLEQEDLIRDAQFDISRGKQTFDADTVKRIIHTLAREQCRFDALCFEIVELASGRGGRTGTDWTKFASVGPFDYLDVNVGKIRRLFDDQCNDCEEAL